jgi:Transposase
VKRVGFTEEPDHCGSARARGWGEDGRPGAQAGHLGSHLCNWKAKYSGLEVSEGKRLRMLEDENRKLKKLLAESVLDNAALKELKAKNVWSAPALRAGARRLRVEGEIGRRQIGGGRHECSSQWLIAARLRSDRLAGLLCLLASSGGTATARGLWPIAAL